MTRRRAVALVVIVALLLVALAALRWATHPTTVGPLLLGMAGDSLGLEIEADGFEYRLRGTPQVVAHGVSARVPGTDLPLLQADRVLLALPWSTLRARGALLDVQRLELDAPVVDLPAFQRWRAQRPPGDGTARPSFQDGIRIVDGRVHGDGWRLTSLAADIPRFAMDAPLRAHVRGRLEAASLGVPFDLRLSMTRAAARAGIGIAGTATPTAPGWQLPGWLRLSGRLDAGDGRIGLQHGALSLRGRLRTGGAVHPLAAGVAGDVVLADGALRAAPLALALRGEGLLPRLRADGTATVDGGLSLTLAGAIEHWPSAWPVLPAPLDRNLPLPFALGYRGAADLSAPLALELERGDARFDGQVRLHAIGDWLDQLARGTPLPPIQGQLRMPVMQVPGATLHGVEIDFDGSTDGARP